MLSKNIFVSRSKAMRRLSSKWNSSSGLGRNPGTFRMCSHWPAKSSTSACERGSASMRCTCSRRTSGSCNVPCTATSTSSSSGMLLHRKNERREASSRSEMRYGVLGATDDG